MKKLILIIISLFLIGYYIFDKHVLMYVYYNQYTSTKPFKYIGKTIKELDKVLKKTKKISHKDGQNYDYLYFNAYGSGFIKDNNYPNDLDYEIGINLGEYNYDGKNKEEISRSILNKINSFEATFNEAALKNKNFYTVYSQNSVNDILKSKYESNLERILSSFDLAISEKNYMIDSYEYTKENENKYIENKVTSIIRPQAIILDGRSNLLLFSHIVSYNSTMKERLREISLLIRFFATIKQENKETIIEINLGENAGVEFDRKFFAQSVYIHNNSANYLKRIPNLNNDEAYLKTKFLTFEQFAQTIPHFETNCIKQAKRTIQMIDFLQNLIDEDFYKKSRSFLTEILTNKELELLNEYLNTYDNLHKIIYNSELFFYLKETDEPDKINTTLKTIEETLYKNEKIDKNVIEQMKNFREKNLKILFNIDNHEKLQELKYEIFSDEYWEIMDNINNIARSEIKNYEFMNEILKEIEKKLKDFGYNDTFIAFTDKDTITFIENDFVKSIDDMNLFIKLNNIDGLKIKIIKAKRFPDNIQLNVVKTRYYSTKEQRDKYEEIKEKFLEEKDKFKLKYKFVWIK